MTFDNLNNWRDSDGYNYWYLPLMRGLYLFDMDDGENIAEWDAIPDCDGRLTHAHRNSKKKRISLEFEPIVREWMQAVRARYLECQND